MAKNADKGEYDYEGDMAMSQLKSVMRNAQKIHDMLSPDTNLPEWVQSKITLAEDYITTAANYLQSESASTTNEDIGTAPANATGSAVYGTNGETPPMFPKAIQKYKKSNQPLKRKSLEDFRKGN
jgi:hypothetical protein